MERRFLSTIIMLITIPLYLESSEPLKESREQNVLAHLYCLNHEKIFHAFVEHCSAREMRLLIGYYKKTGRNIQKLINFQDDQGVAPIHRAAQLCKTHCLQQLIEHGADVDVQDGKGRTPLHYAATTEKRGNKKRNHTVQILCKAGADKNITNKKNRTAKDLAFDLGHHSAAYLILAKTG